MSSSVVIMKDDEDKGGWSEKNIVCCSGGCAEEVVEKKQKLTTDGLKQRLVSTTASASTASLARDESDKGKMSSASLGSFNSDQNLVLSEASAQILRELAEANFADYSFADAVGLFLNTSLYWLCYLFYVLSPLPLALLALSTLVSCRLLPLSASCCNFCFPSIRKPLFVNKGECNSASVSAQQEDRDISFGGADGMTSNNPNTRLHATAIAEEGGLPCSSTEFVARSPSRDTASSCCSSQPPPVAPAAAPPESTSSSFTFAFSCWLTGLGSDATPPPLGFVVYVFDAALAVVISLAFLILHPLHSAYASLPASLLRSFPTPCCLFSCQTSPENHSAAVRPSPQNRDAQFFYHRSILLLSSVFLRLVCLLPPFLSSFLTHIIYTSLVASVVLSRCVYYLVLRCLPSARTSGDNEPLKVPPIVDLPAARLLGHAFAFHAASCPHAEKFQQPPLPLKTQLFKTCRLIALLLKHPFLYASTIFNGSSVAASVCRPFLTVFTRQKTQPLCTPDTTNRFPTSAQKEEKAFPQLLPSALPQRRVCSQAVQPSAHTSVQAAEESSDTYRTFLQRLPSSFGAFAQMCCMQVFNLVFYLLHYLNLEDYNASWRAMPSSHRGTLLVALPSRPSVSGDSALDLATVSDAQSASDALATESAPSTSHPVVPRTSGDGISTNPPHPNCSTQLADSSSSHPHPSDSLLRRTALLQRTDNNHFSATPPSYKPLSLFEAPITLCLSFVRFLAGYLRAALYHACLLLSPSFNYILGKVHAYVRHVSRIPFRPSSGCAWNNITTKTDDAPKLVTVASCPSSSPPLRGDKASGSNNLYSALFYPKNMLEQIALWLLSLWHRTLGIAADLCTRVLSSFFRGCFFVDPRQRFQASYPSLSSQSRNTQGLKQIQNMVARLYAAIRPAPRIFLAASPVAWSSITAFNPCASCHRVVGQAIWYILDLSTLWTVSAVRLFSGAVPASGLQTCVRPKQPLILFEYEGCPSSKRVREVLSVLELDHIVYPCPREAVSERQSVCRSRYRCEVELLGGKVQIPFLSDSNSGVRVFDSYNIVEYLWSTYGQRAKVPLNYYLADAWKFWRNISLPLHLTLRPSMDMGIFRCPSKHPTLPIDVWGFEASPATRRVREVLSSLELPHHMHVAPLFSDTRRKFIDMHSCEGSFFQKLLLRYGDWPCLSDRNTLTTVYGQRCIVHYLQSTYQLAMPPQESSL